MSDWVLLALLTPMWALGVYFGALLLDLWRRRLDQRGAESAIEVLNFGPRDSLILEMPDRVSIEDVTACQSSFKAFIDAQETRVVALPRGWRIAAHLRRGAPSDAAIIAPQ